MTKKRTQSDIAARILQLLATRPSASKTWIVYQANLNFRAANRYLAAMHRAGYIARSGREIAITPKGHRAMAEIAKANEMLRDAMRDVHECH